MKATIKVIGEVVVVSDKFKKRDLVLTFDNGQYPDHRIHQLVQDKVSLLDKYQVGEVVNVEINYKGREWVSPTGEVKYFNTDEVWKIERVDGSSETVQQKRPLGNIEARFQEAEIDALNEEFEDDLPF